MKENDIKKLMLYLSKLTDAKFYGKVVITFQGGQIDTIKTETVQRIDKLDCVDSPKQHVS